MGKPDLTLARRSWCQEKKGEGTPRMNPKRSHVRKTLATREDDRNHVGFHHNASHISSSRRTSVGVAEFRADGWLHNSGIRSTPVESSQNPVTKKILWRKSLSTTLLCGVLSALPHLAIVILTHQVQSRGCDTTETILTPSHRTATPNQGTSLNWKHQHACFAGRKSCQTDE